MINIESRLTDVAKGWIDEEARTLAGHPDAATWERYGAGELPAGEIETLRDHLVTCRACRKLVLGGPKAGATIVPEPEVAMASADAEERRAWHELKKQYDEMTPALVHAALGRQNVGDLGPHFRRRVVVRRRGLDLAPGESARARVA